MVSCMLDAQQWVMFSNMMYDVITYMQEVSDFEFRHADISYLCILMHCSIRLLIHGVNLFINPSITNVDSSHSF